MSLQCRDCRHRTADSSTPKHTELETKRRVIKRDVQRRERNKLRPTPAIRAPEKTSGEVIHWRRPSRTPRKMSLQCRDCRHSTADSSTPKHTELKTKLSLPLPLLSASLSRNRATNHVASVDLHDCSCALLLSAAAVNRPHRRFVVDVSRLGLE